MRKAINLAASLNMATHWQTCFAGGTVRNAWPGASTVNGIMAAHMVSLGFTGEPNGPATTYGVLLGEAFSPDVTLEGLGKEFEVLRGYFKQHSCCAYNHPPIDALEQVLKEHPEIRPDQITQIVVETHSKAAALRDPAPETTLAARFSIPYAVAARVMFGQCSPAAFTEEQIRESRVRALAQKVTVMPSPEFDAMVPYRRGARVTVETVGGRRYSAMLPNPVGDSEFRAFTPDELRDKFRRLVTGVIGRERTDQTIALIENLEKLEGVRKLTAVLAI
jgi:2-methylcitrate dehydratase PrpD